MKKKYGLNPALKTIERREHHVIGSYLPWASQHSLCQSINSFLRDQIANIAMIFDVQKMLQKVVQYFASIHDNIWCADRHWTSVHPHLTHWDQTLFKVKRKTNKLSLTPFLHHIGPHKSQLISPNIVYHKAGVCRHLCWICSKWLVDCIEYLLASSCKYYQCFWWLVSVLCCGVVKVLVVIM